METEWIAVTEVAKMIRAALKAEYPGTKFSVRKDHRAIDIAWTDGPSLDAIESLGRMYNGASFDSMIDLESSIIRYRMPSGELIVAHDGKVPEGAVAKVMFSNSYVFARRAISEEFGQKLAAKTSEYWGVTIEIASTWADGTVNGYKLTAGTLPQGLWADNAVYMLSRETAAE